MDKKRHRAWKGGGWRGLTAGVFCVGLGLVWLPWAWPAVSPEREAVEAQRREPITLGDGEQELTVEEALRELADRTGWLVMIDPAVDLTRATIPARHRSVAFCVDRIAEAVGQRIDWPDEQKILLLYPPPSENYGLWGRIQHESWQAANWVGWRRSLLDLVCSLTEAQRQGFREPPHWRPWRDLSPTQQQLIRRELISPWDEQGIAWEALEADLQVFVGAQVATRWRIGQHEPGVPLRITPGFPPFTSEENRLPRRPPVPIELPGDTDRVVTVEELLERIQKGTGQEIYAEPELGERGIRLIGAARAVPDTVLRARIEQLTWGVWQRVEDLYLLTVPEVSDLGWGDALGKKYDLWRNYNEDLLAELRGWLSSADLPVAAQPVTKPFHRLGDLEVGLQAELIEALKRGLDDLTKRVIGEQFLRADWLSDSQVRFSPYLALGFLHPKHGRRWYGAGPL